MKIGILEICKFLESQGHEFIYNGSQEAFVTSVSSIADRKPQALSWIKKLDNFDMEAIDEELSLVIITGIPYSGKKNLNIISTKNPKTAYFSLLDNFFLEKSIACIAPNATVLTNKIGNNVSIGYNCFIGKDVEIGSGTVIHNNVVIENKVKIGEDCIIESGAVIGGFGFGYYDDPQKRIKKVPDLGGVIIGNRVDIGANTCIVRGTLGNTIIGDDVKIDNLVHIAHNVVIEKECMVIALSMLGGSTKLGKRAYIAPSASIINQIEIGENALVGMGAVVVKAVDSNKVVVGNPAKVLSDKADS